MRRLVQDRKFRYCCGIILILALLVFKFNILPLSDELLLSRYEKELAPIHIETISGMELTHGKFLKGDLYIFYYKIVDGDKNLIMKTLGKRMEECGWEYIQQERDTDSDTIYYVMEKEGYLVRIFASNRVLRINIKTQVNRTLPSPQFRVK